MPANACLTATSRRLRAAAAALLAAALLPFGAGAQDIPPADRTEQLARLATLPASSHNSELRRDTLADGSFRHWINSNEDDLRLYTPAGGQLDADMQVSAEARAGEWPGVVSLRFESRGYLLPGPGDQALRLQVDGRPLAITHRSEPPARSGPLLFLAVQAELPLEAWLALITADQADGRIWGRSFRMPTHQLELLRAWTRALGSPAEEHR